MHREKRLQRAMFQIGIDHRSQSRSHTDTVVRTERRALGLYPSVLDPGTDRILLKIKCKTRIFLANHIHVGLKNNHRAILIPFRCRNTHHHVSGLIGLIINMVLFSEFYQKLTNFLLLLRGARNARNSIELLPDQFRLKFRNFRHKTMIFNKLKSFSFRTAPHPSTLPPNEETISDLSRDFTFGPVLHLTKITKTIEIPMDSNSH